MHASRGIVFSLEAAVAATILLSVMLALAYTPQVNTYAPKIEAEMTVAHDMIIANSDRPPSGYKYGSQCSGSSSLAKLVVSQYYHRNAEVCMP